MVWEPPRPNSFCFAPELVVFNEDMSLLTKLFEKHESLVAAVIKICAGMRVLMFWQWNHFQVRLRYIWFHPMELAFSSTFTILCLKNVGIVSIAFYTQFDQSLLLDA